MIIGGVGCGKGSGCRGEIVKETPNKIKTNISEINDALIEAAKEDNISELNKAIEAGASIDYQSKKRLDGSNWAYFSSLHVVCFRGILSILLRLFELNANVNIKAEKGITPLYVASYNGHHPVVEALLQHGAAVDQATTTDGKTPLYVDRPRTLSTMMT